MARSVGLAPRRGYMLDRETILLGAVAQGYREAPAETRTGAARLLSTRLDAQDVVKLVMHGQTGTSNGGYILQVASVPEGGTLANASTYATVATIAHPAAGIQTIEVPLSGRAIQDAVRTAGSLTGDVRCAAVRLRPGSGDLAISNIALTSNVATVTIGTHGFIVGDRVTVFCSNPVFNGVYTLTAVDATTISYARTNSNVASASATGTVTNGVAAPAGTNLVHIQPIGD